jgi:hypothetical protein
MFGSLPPHLMVLAILLSLGIFIVLGLTIREILIYIRKPHPYCLRRLTLRLSMAGLLLWLLASIGVGVLYFHLDNPEGIPMHWIAFWGFVGVIIAAIFCLIIADLRMIGDETQDEVNRLWRDIAQTIANHERERAAAKKDEQP